MCFPLILSKLHVEMFNLVRLLKNLQEMGIVENVSIAQCKEKERGMIGVQVRYILNLNIIDGNISGYKEIKQVWDFI